MNNVFWDMESFSQRNLKEHGPHIYAGDPTTGIYFFCFAVGDDEIRTWRPGDDVPMPFANPMSFRFISDNWDFERAMHAQILVKRYGFLPLPLENQDCA